MYVWFTSTDQFGDHLLEWSHDPIRIHHHDALFDVGLKWIYLIVIWFGICPWELEIQNIKICGMQHYCTICMSFKINTWFEPDLWFVIWFVIESWYTEYRETDPITHWKLQDSRCKIVNHYNQPRIVSMWKKLTQKVYHFTVFFLYRF